MLKLISTKNFPVPNGITIHPIKLRKKARTGTNRNNSLLVFPGNIVSFENNFNPSAKGCKIPNVPTTLRPFLC